MRSARLQDKKTLKTMMKMFFRLMHPKGKTTVKPAQ
jgi:hypothetical protein